MKNICVKLVLKVSFTHGEDPTHTSDIMSTTSEDLWSTLHSPLDPFPHTMSSFNPAGNFHAFSWLPCLLSTYQPAYFLICHPLPCLQFDLLFIYCTYTLPFSTTWNKSSLDQFFFPSFYPQQEPCGVG